MRFPTLITSLVLGLLGAAQVQADQVRLQVDVANPVMTAAKKDTTYLKVGLTGLEIPSSEKRTPVNVALVIDRSGSMSGEKIQKAKEAATQAVDRLGSNDILSVIAYDDDVDVLWPASKVTDKAAIHAAIERLTPRNSTALFAGVSKAAQEVRKFLDRNRVNRVILLSDGLANVGPSSPSELADLGASLIKDGISVTTLGLGLDYNEDLMVKLALKSDGNHAFIENAGDLKRIFDSEFGDVLSVVAQEVSIRIDCAEGIRPVRILGREGEISGQTARIYLNQIYSAQEKFVLLELEVPAGEKGASREIGRVEVSYADMLTKGTAKMTGSASVVFSDSPAVVASSVNKGVMIDVVRLIGAERSEQAVVLRDAGRKEEAQKILKGNAVFLKGNAEIYLSPALSHDALSNESDAKNLDGEKWQRSRKMMRSYQQGTANQQSYR